MSIFIWFDPVPLYTQRYEINISLAFERTIVEFLLMSCILNSY